jgi:hypothetical protein
MDSLLTQLNVFNFDSYWKVALLILCISALLSYGSTRALKSSWNRYLLSKIPIVRPPWWRGSILQAFCCVVGVLTGYLFDEFTLPHGGVESEIFLSCIAGLIGGMFCTSIVYLISEKLSERYPRFAEIINSSTGDWGSRVELNSNPHLPVYVTTPEEDAKLGLQKSTDDLPVSSGSRVINKSTEN